MSLPRYAEYKDSGVEWLGEVPEHWYMRSLRYAATIQNGSDFKDCEVAEGGYPVLGSGGEFARISKFIYDQPSVLLGRKGTIDNPLYIEEPFWTVDTLFYTKIATDTLPKFFYWFCTSIPFDYFQFGSAVPSMTQNDLYGIKLPTPSFVEQQTIAAFLDRETGKIDALIAEQQRLVELLTEKRQAVISHAVTKGLNPNARMKDSGIEWLGVVPEHWEVLKAGQIGNLFGSEQIAEEYVSDEGDLPFIKVGSLSLNSFDIESWDWYVDSTIAQQCRARSNYIVFPKRGAAIFTNKVNIVERPSLIDPNLMGWQMGSKVIIKYIAYALKSRKIDELADVSTVPQINNKHINPVRFSVPPLNEQQDIADFLDTETAKFDTLTAEASRAIALLQERRSALISAAVTGKIDVRTISTMKEVA